MSEAAATTPEAQLTVAAKGLEKRFGVVAALRGVDLEVPRNHIVAVVGPNGAGKSTLLRILSGLVRPTAGHLSICGQSAGERGGARAHVGFVGHATLLYPELTAHENLLFAARLHGVARPRESATQLLEDVGLSELANRRIRHFSSGSSQRLSIARALVHDPRLLLLDEPFRGLDQASAASLASRLTSLRDSGRSLVLVTHDLQRAGNLADSTLILERGRIRFRALAGEPGSENLQQTYADLMSSQP
jgi:heme ABC exporter ATP-binding subunit CcmA